MQSSLQIVDTLEAVETTAPAPVELTVEEMQQVGGGGGGGNEGPAGTW